MFWEETLRLQVFLNENAYLSQLSQIIFLEKKVRMIYSFIVQTIEVFRSNLRILSEEKIQPEWLTSCFIKDRFLCAK